MVAIKVTADHDLSSDTLEHILDAAQKRINRNLFAIGVFERRDVNRDNGEANAADRECAHT